MNCLVEKLIQGSVSIFAMLEKKITDDQRKMAESARIGPSLLIRSREIIEK